MATNTVTVIVDVEFDESEPEPTTRLIGLIDGLLSRENSPVESYEISIP